MRLSMLRIERKRWGDNNGKLEGEMEIESPTSKMTVLLDPERCDKIVALVADLLVDQAKANAENLKMEGLSMQPLLESSTNNEENT